MCKRMEKQNGGDRLWSVLRPNNLFACFFAMFFTVVCFLNKKRSPMLNLTQLSGNLLANSVRPALLFFFLLLPPTSSDRKFRSPNKRTKVKKKGKEIIKAKTEEKRISFWTKKVFALFRSDSWNSLCVCTGLVVRIFLVSSCSDGKTKIVFYLHLFLSPLCLAQIVSTKRTQLFSNGKKWLRVGKKKMAKESSTFK